MRHLTDILEKIRKAGLTVKLGKCQFAMSQCVYLGHIVGNGMVKAEMSKVKAIEKFPLQETKKDIRTFLGLTGYYRKFIPDYDHCSTLIRSNQESTPKFDQADGRSKEGI